MVLSDGNINDVFIVNEITAEPKVKKRLQDMGLTVDTRIKIISFYSNSVYIVNIRGSRVAIAKDIAENISVRDCDCRVCNKKMIEI